jgi:hypothetical protein
MIRIASLSLLLSALIAGAHAQEEGELPENVVQLRRMANQAHDAGNREEFRSIVARLHELRPNNSNYMYQLVLAHAALGELNQAFDMMLRMQRQGLSYDFNQSPDSENLRGTNLYDYLNDLMIKAGEPIGEYMEVASLDPEVGRVQAIDWDPGREAFLIGTVTDGRLLEVRKDGSFRELLRADNENGLWGIHDLVVDPARNRLWLASAATRAFSGFDITDKGRSDLFELKLDSLELVKRYPVPVDGLPHSLGSMTLSADGDLFLADQALPIIYLLKAGDDRLMPVFASKGLVSIRGIAVDESGKRVFAADREMGIVRLDLESGQVANLIRAETLNVGGIDGLEYVDGDLLALQNGISPQRIMRLALDDSGSRITEIAPILVAPEGIDRPTYGAVVDDTLYFLARAQTGEAEEGPRPLRIAATGIEGVRNIMPPDMKRYMEQQARQRMQPPTPLAPVPAVPAEEASGEEDKDEDG